MDLVDNYNLSDNDYMKKHYLTVYLEDAISQLLENRLEGNKSLTMKPSKFFKEYFTSVHQGTHVLFREYQFICASPYNRLCALKALMQIYESLFFHHDYMFNAEEYSAIVDLLFKGFPMQVIEDAISAYDDDKKDEENRLKFIDFVKAMKASFCTGEYDAEATIIYNQIEDKIFEYSNLPAKKKIYRKSYWNFTQADSLNMKDDNISNLAWIFQNKIIDGSEFKRILNLNVFNSDSSDESVSSVSKLSRFSSESKESSKPEKIGKKKKRAKRKPRGRLAGKHLSNSLSALESGKKDDENKDDTKKGKRRHRSKSAVADERSLRSK